MVFLIDNISNATVWGLFFAHLIAGIFFIKAKTGNAVKNDLKENVTSFKESALAEDEAADVVIIVGADFD